MALYFFLAGLLVSRTKVLYPMPSASVAMALIAGAAHVVGDALLPAYR
jgi:cyclopropane-fatty-acyl-phospholipid synthase